MVCCFLDSLMQECVFVHLLIQDNRYLPFKIVPRVHLTNYDYLINLIMLWIFGIVIV